ncbi:hypothetical protein ACLOJK_020020 [Asimina triloba]
MENSLEKIKRQLTSGSGKNLLQGPLLKRSETVLLLIIPFSFPVHRSSFFVTVSSLAVKLVHDPSCATGVDIDNPVHLGGLGEMNRLLKNSPDIGTPQKKEYFLCAETPSAARAWVSTLHASQLVLRAHKEAVNSLSGNGSAKLGTVATVVAAANSTAMEASKEIEAAMRISMRQALGLLTNKTNDGHLDDLTIMKETLRVKDEELQHLARDLRARDSTIKEIAEKLSDTAEAAEAAASAAHVMDQERRIACAEIERLRKESEKQFESTMLKLRASEEQVMILSKEKDQLFKQRDSALQEAHMWRSELAKARECVVILEAAVLRAEERARVSVADAEAKLKAAADREAIAAKEKEELLAYATMLQTQIQRQQSTGNQVFEEKAESCSGAATTLPLTKHVDSSDDDVDKACLSMSRSIPLSGISENDWSDVQTTDAGMADVKEISPETEQNRDIPVVNVPVDSHNDAGGSLQP